MARRVEERDPRARFQLHLVGADVLGDAASFASDNVRGAQRIEQRCLAVIDVAHDSDHRRTRLQRLGRVINALKADLDVRFRHAPDGVAKFLDDQLGGIRIQRVGCANQLALLHHVLHDVSDTLGHPVCKIRNRDRFRELHLADDLLRAAAASHRLAARLLALSGALHGRVGTLPIIIIGKRA